VNLLVTGTADGETFVFDRRKIHRENVIYILLVAISSGVGL